MSNLTSRQAEILETICRLHYLLGRRPTLRDATPELGMASINGLRSQLVLLERKGYVTHDDGSATTGNWRVVKAPPGWVLLPGGGIVPTDRVPALVCDLMAVQRKELASVS